jgi:Na+-driven multidrug efflux pump
MNAFYQANLSFTSQNDGAGNYKRIDKILVRSMICATVVGLITGGACYLLGPKLLLLYTSSPTVIETGMVKLTIIALPYFLCGIMETVVGSLRGMGYTILPMISTLCGTCILRVLWVNTITNIEQYHRIEMVYLIYPISWIITLCVHLISYLIVRKKVFKS